ncbi:hypothetical protein KEM56_007808 [Ascosphaera pollenicola]|nr:hypothetical protein KEM56_007808 [Ascosphaera pollenicola]
MFLLNNTFIMGSHCLVGASYLNLMTNSGLRKIIFALLTAIVSFLFTLPRTLKGLSLLGAVAALMAFISIILTSVFVAIEPHPEGFPEQGEPIFRLVPAKGTSFIDGMSAFLNIAYTFIGQITLPSFIAEMENPKDFPKSLWALTICEVILFGVLGSVVYAYTGTQYMTSPAFGSIANVVYRKIAFTFMIPTVVFGGVLYASVLARFIFFRIFGGDSRHKTSHTAMGWSTWALVLAVLWGLAFLVAEVIPVFNDLLSVTSSVFGSFFGFIFWGVAYIRMKRESDGPDFYKRDRWKGWLGLITNLGIIVQGESDKK